MYKILWKTFLFTFVSKIYDLQTYFITFFSILTPVYCGLSCQSHIQVEMLHLLLWSVILPCQLHSAQAGRYFSEGEELELFDFLTNKSCYDVRKRPSQGDLPLDIHTSMFVYFIGNIHPQSMEFETHLLFRHRWKVE